MSITALVMQRSSVYAVTQSTQLWSFRVSIFALKCLQWTDLSQYELQMAYGPITDSQTWLCFGWTDVTHVRDSKWQWQKTIKLGAGQVSWAVRPTVVLGGLLHIFVIITARCRSTPYYHDSWFMIHDFMNMIHDNTQWNNRISNWKGD